MTSRLACFLAICSLVHCKEELSCQFESKALKCQFEIQVESQDKEDFNLSFESGGIVVQSHVTIKREIARDDENTIDISGKLYSEPFSQYGSLVENALRSRPLDRHSWKYGEWLIDFAVAVRGHQQDFFDNRTGDIDRCISILKLAIKTFSQLQSLGMGDAKEFIANAYMTLAESLIFNPYEPRYDEAIKYFNLSQQLLQQCLEAESMKYDAFAREEIEVKLADIKVRTAVIAMEMELQTQSVDMALNTLDMASLAMENPGAKKEEHTATFEKSEAQLLEAIHVFRILLKNSRTPKQSASRSNRLANALQNLASIKSWKRFNTLDLTEEALDHYKLSLGFMNEFDSERDSVISSIGSTLYSLCDGYLQAADYEKAKERYHETMGWYETHNIPAPSIADIPILDIDESLAAAEQELEDYENNVYAGGEASNLIDKGTDFDELEHESSTLYEADLHTTLGVLRMTINDMPQAMFHFEQALERYERIPQSRMIADIKLNLAMAHFKIGNFGKSVEAYIEALDVYKNVVGEGKNPLYDGMDDMISQYKVNESPVDSQEPLINLDFIQESLRNKTQFQNDEL
jgi:tetratricopeptide (TPR) repeat protein